MLTTTVCVALSAAGLAVALLTAWRRRFVRAARIAAVALLPVGLARAGLLGLAADVAAAATDWGVSLVLRPTVWAGFAVLAAAVVLYGGARVGARRTTVPPPSDRAGGGSPRVLAPRRAAPAAAADEGLSDVEAILKKHGI
jgi:hypothetical protein